jgi:hypothetical protein
MFIKNTPEIDARVVFFSRLAKEVRSNPLFPRNCFDVQTPSGPDRRETVMLLV